MKGWVYVITNKAMPGLVKVGYSMKDPDLRAAELNNTGSPHRFVVDYETLVEEPRDVEQTVHGLLSGLRESKEWFHCSVEEAIAAIKSVVGSDAQVENFKHADRAKAEAIRQQKDSEERARRAAEEECRKREAILDSKREEIISRYEPFLKAALPDTTFWNYFAVVFVAVIVTLAILFPEMKESEMFILSTIGAFIIAPFIKSHLEEKAKESVSYKSILSKREAELEAVENERERLQRKRACSGAQITEPRYTSTPSLVEPRIKIRCTFCGESSEHADSHIVYCPRCKRSTWTR